MSNNKKILITSTILGITAALVVASSFHSPTEIYTKTQTRTEPAPTQKQISNSEKLADSWQKDAEAFKVKIEIYQEDHANTVKASTTATKAILTAKKAVLVFKDTRDIELLSQGEAEEALEQLNDSRRAMDTCLEVNCF